MDTEIKSAIFQELENREILPVSRLRNVQKDVETKELLGKYLTSSEDDTNKNLTSLTENINGRRKLMKLTPVSGEAVREIIESVIDSIQKQTKPDPQSWVARSRKTNAVEAPFVERIKSFGGTEGYVPDIDY